MAEKLHRFYPSARIDFLLRKGNEGLLKGHPFIHEVLTWNKKESKYKHLLKLMSQIRKKKYDVVVNLQRFGASGLLTAFSGAKQTVGFSKNPFSFLFSHSFPHEIGKKGDTYYKHETERNHALIAEMTDPMAERPKLYPSVQNEEFVSSYKNKGKFITIAPASVWFTKQLPAHKWLELINQTDSSTNIFLLGGKEDVTLCEEIRQKSGRENVEVLAGKLNFLDTAALMTSAEMNYTNDSAPMHIASAVNAPVTAVFCSTVTEFGFGPLSDTSLVLEEKVNLSCRPCGLHGYKACPKGHFTCAEAIRFQ